MAPSQNCPILPSEHNMELKKPSPCHDGLTPPDSPTKGTVTSQAIVKDLKYLFGVFLEKVLDLTNREPPNTPASEDLSPPGPDMVQQVLECASAELSMATEPTQSNSVSEEQERLPGSGGFDPKHSICTTPDDFKSFEKWASTSQFKTVVETWDKEACKYKIAESVETNSGLDDYAEYAFIVRERVDRNSKEVTSYIDVKSEGLRDTLRTSLHDIKAISLTEDKPSIEQKVLFHFLPELDRCAENIDNSSDHDSAHAKHLRLLIEHLKHAYASISQRLESMLEHGHITYDLLWALFKPGGHVYTTCLGTKEPRCVRFDAGEEMTQRDETWWNLECRFMDYDGVKFGEAGIFLRVAKFRGSKPIESLEAFPLRYHPRHEQVRKDLVERGQKFRDLAGSHTRQCKGSAFFMNKGKAIKVNVSSRVAVDAAFFHEMQPNYARPSLRDLGVKDKDGIAVIDLGAMLMEDREREKEKMRGDGVDAQKLSETDLLVACPTVCCFSFQEKMFRELVVDHGDSHALEAQLEVIFKIAKHFNAILLLDEADAFMASRTALHDNHNRLVTIFLRKLEYYQGVLFLTSNRGIQFDDAILSRIHLIIEYEDLSKDFRRGLWSTFLARARTMQGPALVEEHDLRRLESLALNGREVGSRALICTSHLLTARKIKNIAAIAHALAEADANQVSYKYLELAAESSKKFSRVFDRERPVDGMYV
ncbi:hypothetical protein PENSUB_4871 [Penicillium subrubescens]|uniref:Uncharacterized protein n=1 Tax=Penicillium subrubescens TaxID=1316194 RepID=A0A1Q5UB86_9EURO|nr:hypothetical protein PENSUB_4871 [Penicillium subrubescens]